MRYKLLLLDIDGTLRPGSCEQIPKENAAAVRAVQKAGVKIAIATGRGRTGVGKGLLRDLKPDYWVCAGGAQLVDAKGNDLALHRLTAEEMYALVDFFEDYELPLRFTFHDANYAYIDFAEFDRREKAKNLYNNIVDGEDQDHHLVEMPFGCFGFLPREQAAQFQEKYGYLGLQFLYSYPGSDGCDIMQKGVNKGAGLCELAGLAGLTPEECVAIGDGDNDTAMLYGARAKALILGSFPSPKSREQGFFYGHPQNRFWPLMASLTGEPVPDWQDIEAKKAVILKHGLAVWDTIGACDIRGASDASIRNVEPNDVAALIRKLGVQAVFCNGAASGRVYAKYAQASTGMPAVVLPSTSPANAAWSMDRLRTAWGRELLPFLQENGCERTDFVL